MTPEKSEGRTIMLSVGLQGPIHAGRQFNINSTGPVSVVNSNWINHQKSNLKYNHKCSFLLVECKNYIYRYYTLCNLFHSILLMLQIDTATSEDDGNKLDIIMFST